MFRKLVPLLLIGLFMGFTAVACDDDDGGNNSTNSATNSGTNDGTNTNDGTETNSGTNSGTNDGTNSGTNDGTNSGTNDGTGLNDGTNDGTNTAEICDDTIDNDGDGDVDCDDSDCANDPACTGGDTEVCNDGTDNDGDGDVDCDDSDCANDPACTGACQDDNLNNHDPASAYELTVNEAGDPIATETGAICDEYDPGTNDWYHDWFKFTVTQDGTLTIRLDYDTALNSLDILVYDEDPPEITTPDAMSGPADLNGVYVEYFAEANKVYYIEIQPWDIDSDGVTYELSLYREQ